MLREAGWPQTEGLFRTNICHERPPSYLKKGKWVHNDIDQFFAGTRAATAESLPLIHGRFPRQPILTGLARLHQLASRHHPQLIIALGNTALWGLCGHDGITKWRGSVLPALSDTPLGAGLLPTKVVPTLHPSLIVDPQKGMWTYRSILVQDLRRALAESRFPELRRPDWDFTIAPTLSQLRDWLTAAQEEGQPIVSDTEGWGVVDCIGFATSSRRAICIPFTRTDPDPAHVNYWSIDDECRVFALVRSTLERLPVTFHNAIWDMQVICRWWGYYPRLSDDTMVAQHVAFPGLLGGKIDPVTGKTDKQGSSLSLSFISSMYCDIYRYWKDDGRVRNPGASDDDEWRYNCLTGDTLVLMAGLNWKPLKEIEIGQCVTTFEEEPDRREGGYARKLRVALITDKQVSHQTVCKVTLSDGRSLRGTGEHRLLRRGHHNRGPEWVFLKDLIPGDNLYDIGVPWIVPQDYDSAWLTGLLDGEGTIGAQYMHSKYYTIRPALSQKEGPVLARAINILHRHGFNFNLSSKSNAEYVDVSGGLPAYLRLLGMFPTVRLRDNFLKIAMNTGVSGFSYLPKATVVSMEEEGEEEVYDITTSEGTFIANGIFVHNCEDCARTYECRSVLVDHILPGAGLTSQYQFVMSVFRPVLKMMFRGLPLNLDNARSVRAAIQEARRAQQDWLNTVLGYPLNVHSTHAGGQMQALLYEDLALPPSRSRKTGALSTDDETLEGLCRKNPLLTPLLRHIQNIRSLDTNEANFIRPVLGGWYPGPGGKPRYHQPAGDTLHTCLNPAGTETFRFSSNETAFGEGMNSQNFTRPPED